MLQIAEYKARSLDPLKLHKQKLLAFLQGTYSFPTLVSLFLFIYSFIFGNVERRWVLYMGNSDQNEIHFIATGKYEPVNVKWTTERCAVCRWVEDWEDNKIIICNR